MATIREFYILGDDNATSMEGAGWKAQTFKTGPIGHSVTSVKLKLYRVLVPNGTLNVRIRAVNIDGHPILPDLATGSIPSSSVTAASPGAYYEIALSEAWLNPNTKYAIVVNDTSTVGAVAWRGDWSSPAYVDGNMEYSWASGADGTWGSQPVDLMFEVWGEDSVHQGPNNGSDFSNLAWAAPPRVWLNPSYAQTSNNIRSTVALAYGPTYGEISTYLIAAVFGFTIPEGYKIDGVKVEVEMSANKNTHAYVIKVRLCKNGLMVGNNLADTYGLTTTDTYRTYGGPTNLWGLYLTRADVNAAPFGVGVSVAAYGDVDGTVTARIDHIRMTIYCSPSIPMPTPFGIDTILRTLGIRTSAADTALKALEVSKTYGIDGMIVARHTSEYGIDVQLERAGLAHYHVDTLLKALFGTSAGYDVETLLAVIATRGSDLKIDVALKGLARHELDQIDTALQRLILTSDHSIDTWLKAMPTSEVNLTAILKGLSLSELCRLDTALRRLDLQSSHHINAFLILRKQVSLAIGVFIKYLVSRRVHIGAYLVSPQKFDISLSFEQLSVKPSFEQFGVAPSFESFEVKPYFQEV